MILLKNYLLLILIFIFSNNFIPSLSLYVKDVSPVGHYYKSYSLQSCYFSFRVLCVSDDGSCKSLQSVPSISSTIEIQNSTATIFSISTYPTIGSYSISFYSDALVINYECIELDLDLIYFKLINQYYRYSNIPSNLGSQLIGIYEIQNVQNYNESVYFPILVSQNTQIQCYFVSSGGVYYRFFCDLSNIPSDFDLSSNINVTLASISKSKSFQLEPLFKKEYNNQITSYELFPDSLNYDTFFESFGYFEFPVISFTINNSFSNLVYNYKINGNTNSEFYHPVYLNETHTTFKLPMNKLGSTYYDLFVQNGKNFSRLFTVTSNYSQFSFDSPQIPISLLFNSEMVSYYFYQLPLLNIGFLNNSIKYSQTPFTLTVSGYSISKSFPFGFVSSTLDRKYSYNVTSLNIPYRYKDSDNYIGLYSDIDNTGSKYSYLNLNNTVYNSSLIPLVDSVEMVHIVSDIYLYRFYAKIPYKFAYIKVFSTNQIFGPEILMIGNLYEGIFEFKSKSFAGAQFQLFDSYENSISILDEGFISINPPMLFQCPFTYNFDPKLFKFISFLKNDLDVSNHRVYNVLYYNYTDSVKRQSLMVMHGIDQTQNVIYNPPILSDPFYSTWNETIKLYQIEFYVDANIPVGDYPFIIYFSPVNFIYSGLLDTQLRINKSNCDLQGPIFKKIIKNNNNSIIINENNLFNEIGWIMTIEDLFNGFSHGYVIVRGDIDQSIYNITFTSDSVRVGGNVYLGEYDIKLNISYPCINQTYIITEVCLYDRMYRISYFSILPPSNDYVGLVNPFINYLNDSSINKISSTCQQVNETIFKDSTPPTLTFFQLSSTTIDSGGPIRQVQFTFGAIDNESGIKQDQFPVVYLTSVDNNVLECLSYIEYIDNEFARYSCSITIPVAFGYGNNILLSVYGFINNNGLFSGYSTNHLIDLGYTFFIGVTFNSIQPTLLDYFKISEKGGDLWLFGRNFLNDSIVVIAFNNYDPPVYYTPTIIYPTALLIQKVTATDKPYSLYIQSTVGHLIITPTVFDFYLSVPTQLNDSSSSFDNSSTPIPASSPKSCPGKPICGGPSNGKCIKNQGCVCISPWFGIDCLSKILPIEQPPINITSPNTEIILPINNDGNNSSTTSDIKVVYRSLVSIVSLREVDIEGNEVSNKPFKDWVFSQLNDSSYFYNTSLIFGNDSIPTTITNVSVLLQWFINETTISFANQQLLMNPSTIKYTINISNYPFKSKLNQLQLIMLTTIEFNSTDDHICSVKEFGETSSGDNSNYIKVQIDNHSLYGLFIKRGIIDSNIRSISNVLLDSNFNAVSSKNQIQSYIGIQIPYYTKSVTIDPNFGILVDSYSASSKPNSICSNNGPNKLSVGKIAGIVVAGVAFLSIIIISSIYAIKKKRQHKKFLSNVNQKIKNMHNDKL